MKAAQRDLGLCGRGQLQSKINSDTRSSSPPLPAEDRDHMPAAIARTGRHVAKQLRAQLVLHHIARERPRKVLAHANFHKLAVEGDLSVVTDQRHPDIGWADAGQPFQFGNWIIDSTDVYHQSEQLGVSLKHPYGITDRATPDRYVATFEAFAQRRSTNLVIYETDDSVARCNRRRFFRRTDYCHVNAHRCFSGGFTASTSSAA